MQDDLRVDINDLLLDFCNLFYYENQAECPTATRPWFDGSMEQVLLRLSSAASHLLWSSGVPGTLCRPLIITDSDTDPDCFDMEFCPVNVFRKTRMFRYQLPKDKPEISDIDRYRVGRIHIDVVGARKDPNSELPHARLKLDIQAAGVFSQKLRGTWYDFISRPLHVIHEYDVDTGMLELFVLTSLLSVCM
jgi:hypothetical protein